MSERKIINRQVVLPSGLNLGRLYEEKRVEGRRTWFGVCEVCAWEGPITLGQQMAADDLMVHHHEAHPAATKQGETR